MLPSVSEDDILLKVATGMSNPSGISEANVSAKEYSSTEAEFSVFSFSE